MSFIQIFVVFFFFLVLYFSLLIQDPHWCFRVTRCYLPSMFVEYYLGRLFSERPPSGTSNLVIARDFLWNLRVTRYRMQKWKEWDISTTENSFSSMVLFCLLSLLALGWFGLALARSWLLSWRSVLVPKVIRKSWRQTGNSLPVSSSERNIVRSVEE